MYTLIHPLNHMFFLIIITDNVYILMASNPTTHVIYKHATTTLPVVVSSLLVA